METCYDLNFSNAWTACSTLRDFHLKMFLHVLRHVEFQQSSINMGLLVQEKTPYSAVKRKILTTRLTKIPIFNRKRSNNMRQFFREHRSFARACRREAETLIITKPPLLALLCLMYVGGIKTHAETFKVGHWSCISPFIRSTWPSLDLMILDFSEMRKRPTSEGIGIFQTFDILGLDMSVVHL